MRALEMHSFGSAALQCEMHFSTYENRDCSFLPYVGGGDDTVEQKGSDRVITELKH